MKKTPPCSSTFQNKGGGVFIEIELIGLDEQTQLLVQEVKIESVDHTSKYNTKVGRETGKCSLSVLTTEIKRAP